MSILFTLDISFMFKYRPFKISININDYTKRRKTFNIFDFSDQLISDINAGKISSRYSHDNTITLTDGVTCLNMDCSGFACYYLQKIGQLKALQEIKDFVSQSKHIAPEDIKRIYTKEFAIFFRQAEKNSQYWLRITNPADLMRGDIIAFTSVYIKENHTMIVDKILSCTDNELTIRVFDSTGFPHINDTRKNTTGIGSGNVVLFKNETGRWDAYQQSNSYKPCGYLDFGRLKNIKSR